ncbi:hypothetical protein PV779_13650 [Streptomyces sp. ID01-9D]|nr:hypothetical protein [Streptomyces sp. ID01-9D]
MLRWIASRSEMKNMHVRLSTAPAHWHRDLSPTASLDGALAHRQRADHVAQYASCRLTVGLRGSDGS